MFEAVQDDVVQKCNLRPKKKGCLLKKQVTTSSVSQNIKLFHVKPLSTSCRRPKLSLQGPTVKQQSCALPPFSLALRSLLSPLALPPSSGEDLPSLPLLYQRYSNPPPPHGWGVG